VIGNTQIKIPLGLKAQTFSQICCLNNGVVLKVTGRNGMGVGSSWEEADWEVNGVGVKISEIREKNRMLKCPLSQ
jgi:hypothetical protein